MSEDRINELKLRIFELEMENSIQDIRVRSLAKLLERKNEAKSKGGGKVFADALRETEKLYSEEVLKTYSDLSPDMATIVKKYFDKAFSEG